MMICLSRWCFIVWTVRYFWIMFLLLLAFSFVFANAFLRFYWTFSSTKDNHFFDSSELPSPQCCASEGSSETQRGLADSIASPRATSWIKKMLLYIPTYDSINPLMQCSKSNGLNMALFLFMKEGRFGGLGLRIVRGRSMRHSWCGHDNYRWC